MSRYRPPRSAGTPLITPEGEARMRAELDRSDAARLDLKQGAGGIVDLEFLLQTGVLEHAAQQPAHTAVVRRKAGASHR